MPQKKTNMQTATTRDKPAAVLADCSSSDDDDGDYDFPDLDKSDADESSAEASAMSDDESEEDEPEDDEDFVPPIPFWFGNEAEDQIAIILQGYKNHLQVDRDLMRNSRAPRKFAGRVYRQQVTGPNLFTTLDRIELYRRDIVAPGLELPQDITCYLLTAWESESGLQSHMTTIQGPQLTFWKARTIKTVSSYLHCLPMSSSDQDWKYFPAKAKHLVEYADSPAFNFRPFLPAKKNTDYDNSFLE